MKALVGYTGFVGSNLDAAADFDGRYNSKNIKEAYGSEPDLLVYAGVTAAKYLANKDPQRDMEQISEAEKNIRRIRPKKLALISTIDVFSRPIGVDEGATVETEGLHAYGLHRFRLEEWARERYPHALIVRLPALFGRNIKKNFIYDFIHRIPFMLDREKFERFSGAEPILKERYALQENGFYRCGALGAEEAQEMKAAFGRLGFSALNFTDSRSVYQFYPLGRLWEDIGIALQNDLRLLHLATEPISAGELYRHLAGGEFVNELEGNAVRYDFRTRYGEIFGGKNGYMMGKEKVQSAIAGFVTEENRK